MHFYLLELIMLNDEDSIRKPTDFAACIVSVFTLVYRFFLDNHHELGFPTNAYILKHLKTPNLII